MQISHIKIHNVLGIADLEFEPGKFNALTGKNGTGKTSVLEAIKAATQCGHDATLLRKGATEGEIVLVLDDGSQIHRKITADASKSNMVAGGKRQLRPTDMIRALTDLISVNPIEFLRAPKKDRARVLLESMPLQADADRLAKISGVPVTAEPGVHALHVIEAVRKQVYDDRTGTNRAVAEKEATINQLRAALPDAPGGVEGDEDAITAKLDAERARRDAEADRISTKLSGMEAQFVETVANLKAEAADKIRAINDQLAVDVAAQNDWIVGVRTAAARQRELNQQKFAETSSPLSTAIGAIRQNREAAAKRQVTIATIQQMTSHLEELRKDAAAQTAAIEAIDAYKLELLSSLPIRGVEVIDGEITRDGVPFDRLNTAQQVQIAVQIAKLRAGKLGVVCVDGIELLDPGSFEAFREQAMASGLQLFVSRVSGDDFTISVD